MINPIINSFDIWVDAQGIKSKGRVKSIENISLEGVGKLRDLILKMALRGALTTQDPNDEPASELLKRIEKERSDKKDTSLTEIKENEKQFALPKGWEWIRLQQIIQISSGNGLTAAEMKSDGNIPVFGGNGINGYHDKENVSESTLVIGRVGFYCGSIHITPSSAWVTDNAFITSFSKDNIYINFLSWLLKGTNLKENESATAQPVISGRKVYPIVVALPPISEQHRIVAKVAELMALCDKLEEQQFNNLKTHQLLIKALLETLTQATDANELQAGWERMSSHFDTLFCTEDSIDQLKQTILQLAVMGKLVKQDPTDEPASELLKKIARKKEKLIEEGKIRKQVTLPEIKDDEKPFDLPVGWEFCRLDALCSLITKGSSPKWQGVSYTENPDDVLFITSENVGSYQLLLDSKKYVELKFNEIEPKSILEKGDFLMNIVGGSIGRTAIYNIDDLANINQAVCLIRMFSGYLDEQFFLHFFNSSICVSYMFDKQVDNARANLSMGNISRFVMPLPTLKEQKRIVEKVESLFTLCDSMKEKIFKAQELKVLLSKTIIEKAVQ